MSETRTWWTAAACAGFLALAGCGGGGGGGDDASCTDVCTKLFACADALGVEASGFFGEYGSYYQTQADCTARCEKGWTNECAAKHQAFLNCSEGIECSSLDHVVQAAASCFNASGCSP